MKKPLSFSKRVYTIQEVENSITSKCDVTIEEILCNEELETMFALQELIDEVLDLKVGESMFFQPTRDNKDSKGIIVRTN